MKRNNILGLALLASVGTLSAQSVADVMRYTNHNLVGTARYMGMGGAFTALGGDITTLSQNPAGIGVYRSSEIVGTLSIGGVSTSAPISGIDPYGRDGGNIEKNKFNIGVNNIGYVGTFMTGKRRGLISFNVGFAFNRQAGEKRSYGISQYGMKNGLSDYIADRTNEWAVNNPGTSPDELIIPETITNTNDPFYNTDAPWLSIMGYNGYLINNVIAGNSSYYEGAYRDKFGTDQLGIGGDLLVNEKSRIDEYTFNVGGNVSNKVYWGLAIGVIDMAFDQRFFYDESYYRLSNPSASINDFGYYQFDNFLNTSATGVNVKAGIIARLSNSIRLGASVHTPTWYKLTDEYGANLRSFALPDPALGTVNDQNLHSPADIADYRLRTPWRFQVGAAIIMGRAGLLSFDYERADFATSKLSDMNGEDYFYRYTNEDIQNQLSAQNTFRAGAEFRLTPMMSLRLGYANQSSAYSDALKNNTSQFFPSGTITNYTIDLGSQYYTGGLGYRMGNFFTDLAFIWKNNKQDAYLFPDVPAESPTDAPYIIAQKTELKTSSFRFILTAGYKF